jgi:uncharacterized protein (AIM24 family)
MREPPRSSASRDIAGEDFLFHLHRGSEFLQENRVHDAKAELEQALSMQPSDPKGQDLLAIVYFRLGMYPRAISIYERLVQSHPEAITPRVNLALSYLKTGQAAQARHELEKVLKLNPNHSRAWGYLGLAFQRMGDYERASHSFAAGGHGAMVKRLAEAAVSSPALLAVLAERDLGPPSIGGEPERPAAQPPRAQTPFDRERSPTQPRPTVETAPGPAAQKGEDQGEPREDRTTRQERTTYRAGTTARGSTTMPRAAITSATTTTEPPREHFPPPPPLPVSLGAQPSGAVEITPPVPSLGARPDPSQYITFRPGSLTPPSSAARVVTVSPPCSAALLARGHLLVFPRDFPISLHASGVALVRVTTSFATRLDVVRSMASSTNWSTTVMPRRVRGRVVDEPLGGSASPLFEMAGRGELVLGPAEGRRLALMLVDDERLYLREDMVSAFEMSVTYESGRLATGDGEAIGVLQLRGKGAVVASLPQQLSAVEITAERSVAVRAMAVLGWIGRSLPHALQPSEAPAGLRGFVSFTGEGMVLVDGR